MRITLPVVTLLVVAPLAGTVSTAVTSPRSVGPAWTFQSSGVLRDGGESAETGRGLFASHCAACHGSDARGGGPVASELRRPVPDLTRFAMRNGGVFPSARVTRIIDGRDVASHGSREMPVWGNAFRRGPDATPPEAADARIAALTRYLEDIQQRTGE